MIKNIPQLLRQAAGLSLALMLVGCSVSAPENTGTQPTEPVSATAARATQSSTTGSLSSSATASDAARPAGWSEDSHGADADPNYDVVFPAETVNQLTITIAPADWDAMLANMTDIFGAQGTGSRQGGGRPPAGGGGPQGEGGAPGGLAPGNAENPMWVAATVSFNGETWTDVGVRFKGNSSLRSAWSSGSLKLPLKLDFDQFEDETPAITDQRFYGFKQLSFATAFNDATYMREAVAHELLAEAGLTASRTAYYQIVLDYGEGPVAMGLYLAVEVVDDTVIDRVYGSDGGNIYEADGTAASLAAGTEAQIADSFQKENNAAEADWSDVSALYAALHADTRTTDPAAWRAQLEAVFNVDDFLTWLALRSVLGHWDSYGQMAHNYYLYHNPETGQLDFISWDHNEVLGSQGGGGGRGGGPSRTTSFDLAEVNEDWPLIRYLLDDPEYQARYAAALRSVAGVFDAPALTARYAQLAALLEPVVAQTGDVSAFESAVAGLTQATTARAEALAQYLASK